MKSEYSIVIVGAGPTGMMLAGELKLANVEVAVLERRDSQELDGQRAGGLHARTLEILDQRGIVERFVAQGNKHPTLEFAGVPLELGHLPTRHGYVLGLWQSHIERLLADWLAELGVPIHRGHEVVGVTQDDTGVDIELARGEWWRTEYLVGCDGGRSVIRRAAGIEFPGTEPTTSNLIAVAEFAQEPPWGVRRDARGIHGIGRLDDGRARILVTERNVERGGEPTLTDLRAELTAVFGGDFGVHSPASLSRFTDATRQAANYRAGRVLLAGDAAHVHPPDGGQGLQTGMQDAVNLGWKLALVAQGRSPQSLLDSYHAERHPVAARVLRNTMVYVSMRGRDARTNALRDTFAELLGAPAVRDQIAAMMAGLDVRYDFGDDSHPLPGRRMPDLDLATAEGRVRVFERLHEARALLLIFGEFAGLDLSPWADRVRRLDARHIGTWEIPGVGTIATPAAVLIRPDGYVGWVGAESLQGLAEALTRWCGPPAVI